MAGLPNETISLPHSTSLMLSQPEGLCIQLSVFQSTATRETARSAAKSYLQKVYSRALTPSNASTQADFDPCSLHLTEIQSWKDKYLEAVQERDLLKRQLANIKHERDRQRSRMKEQLEGLVSHYARLAEDIEEYKAREARNEREIEVLAGERDSLMKVKNVLNRQVEMLEEENYELKSKLMDLEADYESQLVIYKSRAMVLEKEIEESKFKPPLQTSKKTSKTLRSITIEIPSQEFRRPTQEEIMPFLATASSRWSSLLRTPDLSPQKMSYNLQEEPQPEYKKMSEKKFEDKMRAQVLDSIRTRLNFLDDSN